MTELMNAVILTGFGGPEKLVYTQVAKPIPKQGEVLIKVGACSVNNADINTRTGWYGAEDNFQEILQDREKNNKPISWQQVSIKFPRIQGNGIAGQVVEIGKDVNERILQQRVIINGCILGKNAEECQYFGSELNGGFAEYTVAPITNVYAINSPLSDIELASFPSSYATAENILTKGRVSAADTVLIMGASGGVGSALIQLSKIRDATVIAVVGSSKEHLARELGADYVYPRDEVLAENLAKHQVTAVLDVVGGDYFNLMINSLKVGGKYVCAGAISSPLVNLNLRNLIYKELEMIGATRYDSALFQRLVEYIEQGLLKPLVARVFPLSQIKEAQRFFQAKNFLGKIIITP